MTQTVGSISHLEPRHSAGEIQTIANKVNHVALEKPIIPTFSLAERDRRDTVAIEAGGARRLGRRELAFVSV